jgi:hypothetical protein
MRLTRDVAAKVTGDRCVLTLLVQQYRPVLPFDPRECWTPVKPIWLRSLIGWCRRRIIHSCPISVYYESDDMPAHQAAMLPTSL